MTRQPHVRYPNGYVWLVFVATLDVFFTYIVLRLGGREVNPVAAHVISHWDVPGMVTFKLCLITLAIVIAEEVGRRDDRLGRRFVGYAIALSLAPVTLAILLLLAHASR
jgi:heme/copper-type cytochrome/quinol oxidase subunit 3